MKFVLAIDSFKNCMTSAEANNAVAEGVRDVYPDATILQMPVSDGGEVGWRLLWRRRAAKSLRLRFLTR